MGFQALIKVSLRLIIVYLKMTKILQLMQNRFLKKGEKNNLIVFYLKSKEINLKKYPPLGKMNPEEMK